MFGDGHPAIDYLLLLDVSFDLPPPSSQSLVLGLTLPASALAPPLPLPDLGPLPCLQVTNDVFSMIIIAIAYPDPSHPFHGEYLLYSIAGMFASYVMRKWHFRKPRVEHQAW